MPAKTLFLFFCFCSWALFDFLSLAVAGDDLQRIEILTPNPVGSGARALGMGGAFIAVADDATAASWNPAGLVQLESSEVSLVCEGIHRMEDNHFGTNPDANGLQTVSTANINYLSATYWFQALNRNMVASVNFQRLYDFTREWGFSMASPSGDDSTSHQLLYDQQGGLSAIGFAYGTEITPDLSLGITLNVWNDHLSPNQWEQKYSVSGKGMDHGVAFVSDYTSYEKYSFKGINANIGILWNVNEKFTLGAVLKTPFKADIEHEFSEQAMVKYPEQTDSGSSYSDSFTEDESLKMPMSYGIGMLYKFSEAFSASLDIYRTQWDDFILTKPDGKDISPVTGNDPELSDIKATHQVRIGAEYLWITSKGMIIPLCVGLFYDPAPAEGSPDDFFGFSLGSGIGIGKFHLDMAYQFRFGNDVGSSILKAWDFSQNVEEHKVYSSLIIHF
jgi:long-subunit fatty acid transport protein